MQSQQQQDDDNNNSQDNKDQDRPPPDHHHQHDLTTHQQQQHATTTTNATTPAAPPTFFADVIMDLSEAHDLAETPDPPFRRIVMVSSSSTTAATAAARLQMPMLEGGNNSNTTRSAAAATAAAAAAGGRSTTTSPNSNSSNYHYNSNSEDDDYTPVHSNVGALEVESSSSNSNNNNNNNNNWSSAGGVGEGTEGGGGGHPHQHLEHTTQRIMSSPAAATVVVVVPPRTLPRWPRDLPWAVSFGCTVTTAVLWPVLHHQQQQHSSNNSSNSSSTVYATHPLATASLHTLFWAAICAAMMSRYLYWYPAGGPDGDAKRCTIAATLVLAAPLSVVLNIVVAILILTQCPTAKLTALVPVWYTIRDVYLFRRWRRRRSFFTSPATSTTSATTMTTTTGSNSRQAFFQALTVMALDLTSRSLRRASFYRVLVVILLGQWLTLLWARWALLQALSSSSSNAASVFFSMQFLVTLVAWKWITGTWARFLTLLASGGVMSWFVEQENRMAAGTTSTTTGVDSSSRNSRSMARRDDGGGDNDEIANAQDEVEEQDYDYSSAAATATGRHHNITEAYRTVDASVYSSVLDMEDVLDDDYEQDEEEFMEAPSPMRSFTTTTRSQQQRPSHFHHYQYPHSTVKSILYAGVRVSFGSIAQCGLLGGVAQFVWSQIRKVEYSQFVFCGGGGSSSSSSSIYNISGNTDTSGFQGMPIGSAEASILTKLWIRLLSVARGFVQRYSDLAMCHVAVYYKGYSRAARDVAILVQESGVEPILHDDITTHMCACVGGAISSVIVLFTGLVLLHQRTKPTGVREEDIDAVSDAQVVINMMASFVFSYTLLFTVMEPLRAAIKAIYVCYAQYPVSMSRAFPIIYHRLHRLSEANR